MASVRYSPSADADLDSIARFTIKKWSVRQASIYINKLVAECEFLAENPGFGRPMRGKRTEMRRMECGSHVIYYEQVEDGILVGRILHKRMLAKKHGL